MNQAKGLKWLWKKIFKAQDYPYVSVHRGHGNMQFFEVTGHVFSAIIPPSTKNTKSIFRNIRSLIKRYTIWPMGGAKVQLIVNGKYYFAKTSKKGFFSFVVPEHNLQAGWNTCTIHLTQDGKPIADNTGQIFITEKTKYAIISDIDDTFLVSHSRHFFRKMYLLLTKSVMDRAPFAGVAHHYQFLEKLQNSISTNPFFYVSSSEWNLYDYLVRFCKNQDMPKGIFLLRGIRTSIFSLLAFWKESHTHKAIKIDRLIKSYPDQQFILLGDNGQKDPGIYLSIAQQYPDRIACIYLRNVRKSTVNKMKHMADALHALGIDFLLFNNSDDALQHSKRTLA